MAAISSSKVWPFIGTQSVLKVSPPLIKVIEKAARNAISTVLILPLILLVDKSLNTTKNTAPKPSNEYLSNPSSPGRKIIKTPKNPNTSATTTCLLRISLNIR